MPQPLVVVLEDDVDLLRLLARALDEEGFRVHPASRGAEVLADGVADDAHALVLDIGLPDADGRDVCQALRARGITAPVIFLTARDALVDRLSGFDAGADDYLTKPFAMQELVARLRAAIRRVGGPTPPSIGGLRLDAAGHGVEADDVRVTLTPTEFRLLGALMARPGEAVRRHELARAGWPAGAMVSENSIDAYIARIRRKLRPLPSAPTITTVVGVGYRIG